jgi:polyketide cyclase/dehydrase/lipid transport protein
MDEASVTIEAAPEQVWALVSDITKMGRFSDSNTGGKWIMGAAGPAVGARFVGFNKRGMARWLTTCKVIECEPERTFAFQVNENKMQWGWRVEPAEGGGTLLTQWRNRVGRPAKPVLFVANLLFKGKLDEEMCDGMTTTLAAVKAEAERSSTSTS